MSKYLLAKVTKKLLTSCTKQPAHGLLLEGEYGSGTVMACQYVLDHLSYSQKVVTPIKPEKKSISIEQVRNLRMQVRHRSAQDERQIFVLEQAHTMTTEAQNALLKQLEEPNEGIIYILLSEGVGVLPTIRSRCVVVPVLPVSKHEAATFSNTSESEKHYLISDGLAGLYAELEAGTTTDMLEAINNAKKLLQSTHEEKFNLVENYIKTKQDVALFLSALLKVCHAGLKKAPNDKRWQSRLEAVMLAITYNNAHVQPKLVLDSLVTAII